MPCTRARSSPCTDPTIPQVRGAHKGQPNEIGRGGWERQHPINHYYRPPPPPPCLGGRIFVKRSVAPPTLLLLTSPPFFFVLLCRVPCAGPVPQGALLLLHHLHHPVLPGTTSMSHICHSMHMIEDGTAQTPPLPPSRCLHPPSLPPSPISIM